MKWQPIVTGVLLMSAAAALANFPPRPEWSAEQVAVWQTVTEWNDAFEANDTETYFSFIAPDIVILTPGSPYRVEFKDPDRRELEYRIV
jgi:hypothetical protein